MNTRMNKRPIPVNTVQAHAPHTTPAIGPHPAAPAVQHVPVSFYTALGQLLQSVIERGTEGCLAHSSVFRQAVDFLLHPDAHAKSGVFLEMENNSVWFLLDLNHPGEKFQLQLADYQAPCGGYFLRIREDTKLSPTTAAFVLLHLAKVLGDPKVIWAGILNN